MDTKMYWSIHHLSLVTVLLGLGSDQRFPTAQPSEDGCGLAAVVRAELPSTPLILPKHLAFACGMLLSLLLPLSCCGWFDGLGV